VVVQSDMWHFSISPLTGRKIQKISDMWQPMVLPCHRVHVIMTHVSLYVFHVPCTDVDVIHTDADVNSMDADSSLLTGLG
jgi:hypothetical protein